MRKGFRSSRGAMRGTSGGAPSCLSGGFASVAISFGPFVCSIYPRISKFTWPVFPIIPLELRLSVCRELSRAGDMSIAASQGTEMQQLAIFAQRNGKRFINMHAAYGIAYQTVGTRRSLWCCGTGSVLLLLGGGVFQHPAENAAKKPRAPRDHQQPKQKPGDASKKCHRNKTPQRGIPLYPNKVSLCKGKRGSQTKRRNFKGLRRHSGNQVLALAIWRSK